MDNLKLIHHSLEDWSFPGLELWHLHDTDFVSPPTSIGRYPNSYYAGPARFYLGDALGHNIPDGRIIPYLIHKEVADWHWAFMYRVQDPDGDRLPDNCYYCLISSDSVDLYLRKNALQIWHHHYDLTNIIPIHTWTRVRLTFYGWVDADLTYSLRQIFNVWAAGQWKEQFREDTPECEWQESSVNRLGFASHYRGPTPYELMDDTEIWEKA